MKTAELCARYTDDLNQNWRKQDDEYNYRWMFLPEADEGSPKCKVFKSTNDIPESGDGNSGGKIFLGTAGCKPSHEDFISYCTKNEWSVMNLVPENTARYKTFKKTL